MRRWHPMLPPVGDSARAGNSASGRAIHYLRFIVFRLDLPVRMINGYNPFIKRGILKTYFAI